MLPILVELYTDPQWRVQFILYAFLTCGTYFASIITGNYSQVDRLWSLIPFFYTLTYTWQQYVNDNTSPAFYRCLMLSVLIGLWSVRLTYNYWRKGGYTRGSEDYRWMYVRKWFNYPSSVIPFQLFHLTFISIYQNWLLALLSFPIWYFCEYANKMPLNASDFVLAISFLITLLLETIADEQQWKYQQAKYAWLEGRLDDEKELNATKKKYTSNDFKRGFCTKGLFAYSRHPNFLAEMTLWWIVYFYSVATTGHFLNRSIWGTLLLTLLFQGSTLLTESITKSKYKEYGDYQRRVGRFISFF